ncbi:phosphopantetheine-binding protein [Sphingomonas sp. LY29]|uniref:phosphopantetheine-binding protein n=1 Tax=unclassified Sphingomonas TaxID=196159 RepID=UPI002ADED9E8|nr:MULTISPECIES: phosphopantetheine-binding protein [unclassified Sphingomonas]MEA1071367.1 phosphopantetheine-binding protein [Sphingomonas sp. LY160]WRP25947.1 phosphopantetheine-binding protein [Sphingomonas sp. LY29]
MDQGKFTAAPSDASDVDVTLRALLADTLGLSESRIASFDGETELFGALPEFDSMAVAHLLTGIEERLAVVIDDDDVEAEDFASYGRLLAFAERLALR